MAKRIEFSKDAKITVYTAEEGRAQAAARGFCGDFPSCWPDVEECMICTETTLCFHFDTSQAEYGYGVVCLDCVKLVLNPT